MEIHRGNSNRISLITDDAGQQVRYDYGPDGTLKSSSLLTGELILYRYDHEGRLIELIDPRGIATLTATFDDFGRVGDITVLGNTNHFDYQSHRTFVTDRRGKISSFVQDDSGATVEAVDNAGVSTRIAFNDQISEPSQFLVDDVSLANFLYGGSSELSHAKYVGADSSTELQFDYYPSGKLKSISTDSGESQSFSYDDKGRLTNTATATGTEYSITWEENGQPDEISISGHVIDLSSDAYGRTTGVNRGEGRDIRIGYDSHDRVSEISATQMGSSTYSYGTDKFRATANYDQSHIVEYKYDAAGNIRTFNYESGDGKSGMDIYVVGPNNELKKIFSSDNPDMDFEYDEVGRAKRVTSAGREFQIDYDEQSRVTKATIDGRVALETDYSLSQLDLAHNVDSRTFRTQAKQHPGSGIFGGIAEIVYTRPVYSPYSAVSFDSEMNRFVLRSTDDWFPERILFDGFARRNLPISVDGFSGTITKFDKPSNALFVPPEYASVNCCVCNVVIYNHTLGLYNSSSPSIEIGQTAVLESTAIVTGCEADYGPPPPFSQYIAFGDGQSASSITYPPAFYSGHTYGATGTYNALASMECLCGVFGLSWASTDVDVHASPPAQVVIDYNMFIPLDHVRLPSWLQLVPPEFYAGDGVPTLVPGQYRIRQTITWTSENNQLSNVAATGQTKSYSPFINLSSTISCFRKNCSECPKYPGIVTEDIVYQGQCKSGSPLQTSGAGGMNTIVASISSSTETSVSISFSGEPFNALEPASEIFGDIDWNHKVTIDWSGESVTCTLDYQHDGFPYHDIRINGNVAYQFDPIAAGQTPLSLGGTGSGEWSGSVSCTL